VRDLILAVIILGSIPFAFLKPHVGVYLWYWVGFMNPHRFTWGFMYSFPVALCMGAGTIIGSLFVRKKAPILQAPETILLLALMALFTFNTIFALFATAWPEWEKFIKVLVMTFVTVMLMDTRPKLRMLLVVVVLSIGIMAAHGAIWGVVTGAQYRLWGPPGSSLEDNNAMGLALNMTIPLALFLSRTEPRKRDRLAFFAIGIFSMFGVILTYSRGGLLGLATILGMLFYRARRNVGLAFGMIAAFLVILAFLPSAWFERMSTIKTYEEDESAQSRLNTWGFAWELATKRPLTGGGFEGFRANPTNQNPHSIYFGMLGEQGFIGFGCFIALLVTCYTGLGALEKRTRGDPSLQWYADLAAMVKISLAGFMVSGAFLNLQYFDLFYLIVAIVAIMRYLIRVESTVPAPDTGGTKAPAPKRTVRFGPERTAGQTA
jgi:probable O-glycosylation ligase (exosortase A-associated)